MEVTGIKDVGDWPYPWALNDTGIDWLKWRSIGLSLCLMLSVRQIVNIQLWKQSGKRKSAKPISLLVMLAGESKMKNKKPSCRSDSRPYCRTTDYLVIININIIIIAKYHPQLFSRYCALSVLGSRVWHFRVTWRHRSRGHVIPRRLFPIGGSL